MSKDPAKDFRYADADGAIIEAYQITPATRWQDQKWPPWLKKQRLDSDVNCVFTMADKPDALWLAVAGGESELPYLAWVIKRPDGSVGWIEAIDMEEYTKVVPLPPPVVHPAADEKNAVVVPLPTKLDQERVVLAKHDTNEMRGEMMDAIKMLEDSKPTEALLFLKKSMAARVTWCNCAPGQCELLEGASPEGCRRKSPLVAT